MWCLSVVGGGGGGLILITLENPIIWTCNRIFPNGRPHWLPGVFVLVACLNFVWTVNCSNAVVWRYGRAARDLEPSRLARQSCRASVSCGDLWSLVLGLRQIWFLKTGIQALRWTDKVDKVNVVCLYLTATSHDSSDDANRHSPWNCHGMTSNPGYDK